MFCFCVFFHNLFFFPLIQELESITKLLESKLCNFLCYDGVLVKLIPTIASKQILYLQINMSNNRF
jgi:hypothetical protein